MYDQLKEILSMQFEQIISSDCILTMLKIYSKLYLGGGAPPMCEKCHAQIFEQLKLNGLKKSLIYDKAMSRTLVTKLKGFKFLSNIGKHVNLDLLGDEVAIEYLNSGVMTVDMFEKLPEGYNPNPKVKETIQEAKKTTKKSKK